MQVHQLTSSDCRSQTAVFIPLLCFRPLDLLLFTSSHHLNVFRLLTALLLYQCFVLFGFV